MSETAILEIPSKWDIIPLHTSDRATFKDCRRRWYWSSPAMNNLIPKQSINGVYLPFWFGTGIHYALEKFYNPALKEDPETVFDTWYNLQWNGGTIKVEEVDQFADRLPEFNDSTGQWEIKGLVDVLPMGDYNGEFELHHDLGLGMMRFYKEYAEREDDFVVVNSEHTFSVPIIDPNSISPLMMVDKRIQPNGSCPMEMKEVHARGRMDLIVFSERTGNFAIIDHKTANRLLDDEYFAHTDLDEQCTTYLWAAEQEAKLYDLPYKEIAGIVYQGLRKTYPKPPTPLKSGMPSTDRAKESTTAKMFEQYINDCGLSALMTTDDKIQSYYTYLVESGDKQFVRRWPVTRNEHQKQNAGMRIYMEAMDMLDDPFIYPNPTKNYSCLRCAFRTPCIAVEAGYDYEAMITDGYEKNFDR
jgi:hypothetical protein